MEEGAQPSRGPHFVGKKDELIKAKRAVVTAGGRDILVIHHQDVFYALDCYCYRKYNPDPLKGHRSSTCQSHPLLSQILGETCRLETLR